MWGRGVVFTVVSMVLGSRVAALGSRVAGVLFVGIVGVVGAVVLHLVHVGERLLVFEVELVLRQDASDGAQVGGSVKLVEATGDVLGEVRSSDEATEQCSDGVAVVNSLARSL